MTIKLCDDVLYFPCILSYVTHQGIQKFTAALTDKTAEEFCLLFIISFSHSQIPLESKFVSPLFHILKRLAESKHSVCGGFNSSMESQGSLTLAAKKLVPVNPLSDRKKIVHTQTESSSTATVLKSITSSQAVSTLLIVFSQLGYELY